MYIRDAGWLYRFACIVLSGSPADCPFLHVVFYPDRQLTVQCYKKFISGPPLTAVKGLNRHNSLYGQINDVLCYFGGLGRVTKLMLLKAYCSSYYECELWDLSCKTVDDFCIMWRKGLKCVWGLPRDTHTFLLAPLCTTIPIMDEVCRRSCNFLNASLTSDCSLISFIARQSIFYSHMASPLGRNTHFCCSRYGRRMQDI